MEEGSNDKRVVDLFTKHCHHRNITLLFLTQDLFPPGKFSKTINRNVHYMIAFKSPRDQMAIRTVLLQAFPTVWRDALQIFQQTTQRPYGYLWLDLHPGSDDRHRFRKRVERRTNDRVREDTMNSDDSFGSEFDADPLTMYVDALERDNAASARRQQSTPALQLSQSLGSHGDAYVRPLGQFTKIVQSRCGCFVESSKRSRTLNHPAFHHSTNCQGASWRRHSSKSHANIWNNDWRIEKRSH